MAAKTRDQSAARLANLLSALALGIDDAFADACHMEGLDSTEATALIALLDTARSAPISRLSVVLGVSHSGAVRVADRLEMRGWITRERAHDLRSLRLRLTAAGHRHARRMRREREDIAASLVTGLDARARSQLMRAVEVMVRATARQRLAIRARGDAPAGGALCRRCDFDACERARGRCPAHAAAAGATAPQ